jgi:hypothetical protein
MRRIIIITGEPPVYSGEPPVYSGEPVMPAILFAIIYNNTQ